MYNQELEMLIDAALADGVLTDSEKQILFKKAQSMGINLDEFNMVLDGRLAKVKEQRQAASKSNKQGAIKKCPACGALVQQMQIKCPECGYEFRDVEACSSTQELLRKLDEIEAEAPDSMGTVNSVFKMAGMDKATSRKVQVIKTWPVPNTKEDLIEMLTLCNANRKYGSGADQLLARAWDSKLSQVLAKAKLMLTDDPEGQAIIQEIEAASKKRRILMLCVGIVVVVVFIIMAVNLRSFSQKEEKENAAIMVELKETLNTVEQLVMDGDYEKAAATLSFCKVDVNNYDRSNLYASAVSKVAGGLLEHGDTTQARTLYDSAISKLGGYDKKLDSLAVRLGIKEDSNKKSETKEKAETQETVEESVEEQSSSSTRSEDWDALLDSYDDYVTKYVSYMKKAMNGDMSALSEYPALMEKAEEFSDKLGNAEGEMSSAQWNRYLKITKKMSSAASSI